jgi:hypothetical protein
MLLTTLRRRLRQLRHELHWWGTKAYGKKGSALYQQQMSVIHQLQAEESQILTQLYEFDPSVRYLPPVRPKGRKPRKDHG